MNRRHYGFTVLEFLLASLMSSFLMVSLVQCYLKIKCRDHLVTSLADMQERGRFISDYLTEKIRLAGDQACVDLDDGVYTEAIISGESGRTNDTLTLRECMLYQDQQQYLAASYYISNTGRKNAGGESVYSLYEKRSSGLGRELVANVSRFRVQYGLAASNRSDVARYVNANEVLDWQAVKSVRLQLELEGGYPKLSRCWNFGVALREFAL